MRGEATRYNVGVKAVSDVWLAPKPPWLLRVPSIRVRANRPDKVLNAVDKIIVLDRQIKPLSPRGDEYISCLVKRGEANRPDLA